MFAVIDKPCRPKTYNGLPGIIEADDAIKPLRSRLDQLIDQGSDACRSTPFPRGEIGAFLLHKHWEVEEGECMIERPTSSPLEGPRSSRQPSGFLGLPPSHRVDSRSIPDGGR